MRHKALILAVAALLAFGASGVVTASMTTSPQAVTTAQPADNALPTNHTVEVIDPHDELSGQEAENAWQLTWANDTIKSYFDHAEPVHFQVEAIGDELQVLVATSDTAPPQIQAIVDLESETVHSVEELDNVATADEVKTMDLSPANASNVGTGEVITVEAASTNETFTEDDASASKEFSVTIVDGDAESGTFRVVNETESITLEPTNASGEFDSMDTLDDSDASASSTESGTVYEYDGNDE